MGFMVVALSKVRTVLERLAIALRGMLGDRNEVLQLLPGYARLLENRVVGEPRPGPIQSGLQVAHAVCVRSLEKFDRRGPFVRRRYGNPPVLFNSCLVRLT